MNTSFEEESHGFSESLGSQQHEFEDVLELMPEQVQGNATEQLAQEAIERIKTELLNAPSPSSPAFSLNFAVVDDRVYARLERLGQLIDWPVRYKETLDKLKGFLLTHPRCREEFEVKQDAYNPIIHYVRCRHSGEVVEVPLYSSGMPRGIPDELSVLPNVDGYIASPVNTEALKQDALSTIRDILFNQGSNNQMKLTLLNSRARWPQTFGRTLGSLKQWIRYLNETGEAQDIKIVDTLGPGNDYAELINIGSYPRFSSQRGPRRTSGPPAQAPPQSVLYAAQQQTDNDNSTYAGSMDGDRHTPYFSSAYRESQSQSGVRVRDYFFLPQPTDLIEISYLRSMEQYAAMIRRWTEQRIIQHCWSYDSDQFKKYEWYGDTVLRSELSKILLLNQEDLFDISGLDARRQNAEQRLTMSLLFDELKLAQFVQQCPPSWVAGKWKAKCDFIEALVGELSIKLHNAGERGVPFGHPERESIERFIRSVCQAALDRGAKMKSPQMRAEIDNDADRCGNEGYLMEELDRLAFNRTAKTDESQS